MLDPRRVLVFRAVAASGSFSAAADALHLTQPSVSRSVAALEATVGLPLLVRRREGVVLTEAGERLLARADVVAGHLERAEEELQALARGEEGAVRLGAFPTAAGSFVVAALRDVRRAHPGVAVTLRDVTGTSGAPLVEAGRLDVAVGFHLEGEAGPSRAGMSVTPLLSEPLLVALPRDHAAAGRGRLRLGDLAGADFVQGPAGSSSASAAARASSRGWWRRPTRRSRSSRRASVSRSCRASPAPVPGLTSRSSSSRTRRGEPSTR